MINSAELGTVWCFGYRRLKFMEFLNALLTVKHLLLCHSKMPQCRVFSLLFFSFFFFSVILKCIFFSKDLNSGKSDTVSSVLSILTIFFIDHSWAVASFEAKFTSPHSISAHCLAQEHICCTANLYNNHFLGSVMYEKWTPKQSFSVFVFLL